jgi:hypothetical protein
VVVLLLLLLACDGSSDRPAPPSGDPGDRSDSDGSDTADSVELPPVDLDGDGSLEGEDCDDADPTRFPGAIDTCDGVDQDCDGNPVGEGACGELVVVGETTAVGWWVGETGGTLGLDFNASGTWGRPTDFDGDGILDVVAHHRGPLLLRGRVPWENTSMHAVDFLGNWSTAADGFTIAGDFDGDGWPDVFATDHEDGHEEAKEGAVSLRLGPPSRWSTEWAMFDEDADAHWTHEDGRENFGLLHDAADLNGDGLSDLALLGGKSSLARPSDPGGYLRILPGRTSGLPMGIPIEEEEPWFTLDFTVYSTSNLMAVLPDIDGDGIPELAFEKRVWEGSEAVHSLAIVPTAVLTPAFTGQELTELWEPIPNGDAVQHVQVVRDANELGDVNGDGYGDVALIVYDTMDVHGDEVVCLGALLGGANLPASTTSDQLGGLVCFQRNYLDRLNGNPGRQRVVPDTDGDGIADLFWSAVPSVAGDYDSPRMSCVMPTAQLPSAGKVLVEEVRKFCFGTGTDEPFDETDVADLDGDGLPELLTGETSWGQGRILVTPGFAIPWDDPTRW